MNSLASNVHFIDGRNRAEHLTGQALPATLAGVLASLFSASGRDRLAAAGGSDAADAAEAWGL